MPAVIHAYDAQAHQQQPLSVRKNMVIDIHAHPVIYGAICQDKETVAFRKQNFGLYKSSPTPMEQIFRVLDHAGVDKTVLLAEDYSSTMGNPIVSNQEVRSLVDLAPERFIGFASVDPRNQSAADQLQYAFQELGLSGLKLNLSHLQLRPDDERLKPLYQLCQEQGKPILFHAGMSWEPDSPSKYSRPIFFEDVAVDYPDLRFCLAHLGWPWIDETVMLMLKYRHVYTDTATVYMGSPKEYYRQVFLENMDPGWLQNSLFQKVIYGSNYPRFRQERVKAGLEALPIRSDVKRAVLGENAQIFLGWREDRYD